MSIQRKWFHLVAVLLFLPVTIAAPQLLSLSYAIAISLLLVLECIRRDISLLQSYYERYLDSKKDQGQIVIISHLSLVLGCAAPLWIAEWLQAGLHVSLFGVFCLGVGDSLAAVVGIQYGKHAWPFQHHGRTLEGSLAMLTSMCLCYGLLQLVMPLSLWIWLPACVVVTLLEAYTQHVDNFVLPLAGIAVMRLCERRIAE
jgi:dolichol kinase